ncbi:MAG: hypothetical protein EOP45_08485, partial [Sphingobacteriaceae bacterium]
MADFVAVWNTIKGLYNPFSTVVSTISATGFIGYAIKEIKKKYAKPELACSLVQVKHIFIPIGEIYQDEYGSMRPAYTETSTLRKFCKFTITNNSEHIAYKIKLISKKEVNKPVSWYPLPDYTIPLMPYLGISQDIIIESEVDYVDQDRDEDVPHFSIISEIVFEYKNTSGTKFNLIFKPNEKDVEQRS